VLEEAGGEIQTMGAAAANSYLQLRCFFPPSQGMHLQTACTATLCTFWGCLQPRAFKVIRYSAQSSGHAVMEGSTELQATRRTPGRPHSGLWARAPLRSERLLQGSPSVCRQAMWCGVFLDLSNRGASYLQNSKQYHFRGEIFREPPRYGRPPSRKIVRQEE
jgi:hypothetical protein